jgi:hypothetical protein
MKKAPSNFCFEALDIDDFRLNDKTKKVVVLKDNNQEVKNKSELLQADYQTEKIILMCCPKSIFLNLCEIYPTSANSIELTAEERDSTLIRYRNEATEE